MSIKSWKIILILPDQKVLQILSLDKAQTKERQLWGIIMKKLVLLMLWCLCTVAEQNELIIKMMQKVAKMSGNAMEAGFAST